MNYIRRDNPSQVLEIEALGLRAPRTHATCTWLLEYIEQGNKYDHLETRDDRIKALRAEQDKFWGKKVKAKNKRGVVIFVTARPTPEGLHKEDGAFLAQIYLRSDQTNKFMGTKDLVLIESKAEKSKRTK